MRQVKINRDKRRVVRRRVRLEEAAQLETNFYKDKRVAKWFDHSG